MCLYINIITNEYFSSASTKVTKKKSLFKVSNGSVIDGLEESFHSLSVCSPLRSSNQQSPNQCKSPVMALFTNKKVSKEIQEVVF